MWVALIAIGLLGFLGHLMFWVGVFNKIHATGLPYKLIKLFEKIIYLIVATVPLAQIWLVATIDFSHQTLQSFFARYLFVTVYLALCLATVVVGVPAWLLHRLARTPRQLVSINATTHTVCDDDGARPIGNVTGHLFARIPFNQLFQLRVEEKTIVVPGLPPELDGLSIVHLSDLHFTGHIRPSFFQFVVDRANELNPDLTAVTGDLVDKPECVDWIQPILGRLRAKHGVYCILGNHDKRLPDVMRIRAEVAKAGMMDLGGKTAMITIRDTPILLAGNEMPWFSPAPTIKVLEQSEKPQFRILLSHSPDQIEWARRHGFQLVLAGHTHGGQIRLPLIGPIIAPSRFGVRFASGLFAFDKTIMHVSRGVSGLDPIRINCPPELTKLIIRAD